MTVKVRTKRVREFTCDYCGAKVEYPGSEMPPGWVSRVVPDEWAAKGRSPLMGPWVTFDTPDHLILWLMGLARGATVAGEQREVYVHTTRWSWRDRAEDPPTAYITGPNGKVVQVGREDPAEPGI